MESLIDSKLIGFFMISRRSVKVEEIQHYVYVFMLYMFIVGYAYFTSYFSVFKFNAIGYVGFVDIIKWQRHHYSMFTYFRTHFHLLF